MNNLFKWITWIVVGLTMCAGFAAQADFKGEYKIWYTTDGNFIWCGTDAAADKSDIQASTKIFNSLTSCNTSELYAELSKKYDSNDLTPPNANKPKPKPTEEPDIISQESKPITDVRIHAYITNFEKFAKIKVNRSKIFFGKLSNAIGICSYSSQEIVIDKKYWLSKNSEYDKEAVIYHELGHCFLQLPHNKNIDKIFKKGEKACPTSIMYPTAFGYIDAYRCFHLNRDYYLKQLVKKEKKLQLTIYVYEYHIVKKKWIIVKKHSKAIHGELVEIGGQSCTMSKYKPKKLKNDFVSQVVLLECTKDYVNYVTLWQRFYYHTGTDSWSNGYSSGTHRSSSLRFWNNIVKKNYSIFISAEAI